MGINCINDSASPVLPSCREVALKSKLVFLHPEKIPPAISRWRSILDAAPSWDHPCHFFDGTEETVRWIFTLDLLNHCFWPDPGEPVWTVRYGNEDRSGYWGVAAALKRAIEAGVPVTDPVWLSRVSADELHSVFSYQFPSAHTSGEWNIPEATAPNIPMFSERLKNLREAGSIILSHPGADVISLLDKAAGSAVRLATMVAKNFPSFRDEAQYNGQTVYFWKRAQIFAADIYAAFGGKNLGDFKDIDSLTAFADYKLPQVLRELGIISYNRELAAKVDSFQYLAPGSEPEIEIRAMTVIAVEQIRNEFNSGGSGKPSNPDDSLSHGSLTSSRVDSWLWQLGQLDEFRKKPYHRCRTIYY